MRSGFRVSGLLLCSLIFTGCVTTEKEIHLQFSDMNFLHPHEDSGASCDVKAALTDKEVLKPPYYLGQVMARPVYSNDIEAWSRQSLIENLSEFQSSEPRVLLNLTLKRFSLAQSLSNFTANVVAVADYEVVGREKVSKVFRGSATHSNMLAAAFEIRSVMRVALNDLAQRIATDIQEVCEKV